LITGAGDKWLRVIVLFFGLLFRYMEFLFRDSFRCRRCGGCCRRYAGRFSLPREQAEEWKNKVFNSRFGRYPAIKFVSMDFTLPGITGIFFHPESGRRLDICPFLDCGDVDVGVEELRFVDVDEGPCRCMIYEDRPKGCREYPFTGMFVDLSEDECPVVRDIRLRLVLMRD